MEVYKVSFPRILTIGGMPVQGGTLGRLGGHCMFLHWKSRVAILQEGP